MDRKRTLNLLGLETVLPDSDIGCRAVLTVVEEDNPRKKSAMFTGPDGKENTHMASGSMDSPV
jgi:hypothetical protein